MFNKTPCFYRVLETVHLGLWENEKCFENTSVFTAFFHECFYNSTATNMENMLSEFCDLKNNLFTVIIKF